LKPFLSADLENRFVSSLNNSISFRKSVSIFRPILTIYNFCQSSAPKHGLFLGYKPVTAPQIESRFVD
jgi:hypothetical protein